MMTMAPHFTGQSNANARAEKPDVLIIGGGISGLSLAAWLDQENIQAHVIDKNADPGGVIQTIEQDGFRFERGPNTVLDKHESMDALLAWAGLEGAVTRVPLASQTRYVWLKGKMHAVPTGAGSFLATPLLPATAKLALLREPFVKANPQDESVADFVRRRLGEAWLRNLITPMVSGVWAGNPEQLSIGAAFPVMKEMERDGGSLLRGAIRLMRRKAAERKAAGKPKRAKSMLSFREGLQTLPRALAKKLGERYHGATKVVSIGKTGAGFRVETETGGERRVWEPRELAITAETLEAAAWLRPFDSEAAAALESFPHSRLAVVSLGIESAGSNVPPGFGFLVPRSESIRILGAIFLSNFFPGRAPVGCAAMSVFVGGELDPAALELGDEELLGIVKKDLRAAIGWDGKARSVHLERWPRAIPQYDMRHADRIRQIEAAEARHPGLHLAGNWRGGTSVPDRLEAMMKMANAISTKLEARNSKQILNSNDRNLG